MNSKKLICTIGVSTLLLGIGMNVHNALNDYGIKDATLSTFIQAQGTSSSTIFICDYKPNIPGKTTRDSMDYPEYALLMDVCELTSGSWHGSMGLISVSVGKDGKIYGNRCACVDPGKKFNKNNLGCNAEWETNCVLGGNVGSSSPK